MLGKKFIYNDEDTDELIGIEILDYSKRVYTIITKE